MTNVLTDKHLRSVTKPTRYVGGEYNAIKKDLSKVRVKMAMAFPDVYEVGMSHLGSKILYHVVNGIDGVAMERVFAPWVDMEAVLKANDIPLVSLESQIPLCEFDIVGFSLQYELSFSNVINMLALGQVPLLAKDRGPSDPFVIAGGPNAFNPEPLADFMDAVVIGDGEEIVVQIIAAYDRWRSSGSQDRRELLLDLVKLDGVYVPSFYQDQYDEHGHFAGIIKLEERAPSCVRRSLIPDLDRAPFPTSPIVPFTEVIHDRVMLELFRGCSRGCRFCQAGVLYRPVRERSLEQLMETAEQAVRATGYNDISLTSLSTMDYSQVEKLVDGLLAKFSCEGVGLSLPSLRVDSFSVALANKVQQVRKTGLTLAPEAGSQRLRDVINKNVTEEELITAVKGAFASGWNSVKLYFMLGLPTETDADLEGIANLAQKVVDTYRSLNLKRRQGLRVTVSVSTFVPKPHTPFQWEPQVELEEVRRRQQYLKSKIKSRMIDYNYHDPQTSFLEAVFAKGDRRLAKTLVRAWELGCRFDGWSEHFRPDAWKQALDETGIDPHAYANRPLGKSDPLPWDHLDSGVTKEWLWEERERAYAGLTTEDCREGNCSNCGVCLGYGVTPIVRED